MNRPEPIELENNLGPDAVTGEINRVPWMAYDVDEMDLYIDEKDKEIAELKQTIDKLVGVKKSAEQILQNLLDCGLIKEWFYNGTFNAVLKADDPHLKIAGLKQMLEDAKASHYAESVDAGMRERRLRRALWLARAEMARTSAWVFWNRKDDYNYNKWKKVERKCREKAKEYK